MKSRNINIYNSPLNNPSSNNPSSHLSESLIFKTSPASTVYKTITSTVNEVHYKYLFPMHYLSCEKCANKYNITINKDKEHQKNQENNDFNNQNPPNSPTSNKLNSSFLISNNKYIEKSASLISPISKNIDLINYLGLKRKAYHEGLKKLNQYNEYLTEKKKNDLLNNNKRLYLGGFHTKAYSIVEKSQLRPALLNNIFRHNTNNVSNSGNSDNMKRKSINNGFRKRSIIDCGEKNESKVIGKDKDKNICKDKNTGKNMGKYMDKDNNIDMINEEKDSMDMQENISENNSITSSKLLLKHNKSKTMNMNSNSNKNNIKHINNAENINNKPKIAHQPNSLHKRFSKKKTLFLISNNDSNTPNNNNNSNKNFNSKYKNNKNLYSQVQVIKIEKTSCITNDL